MGPLCSVLMSVFNPKPQQRIPSFMLRASWALVPGWDWRYRPFHEGYKHRTQLPLFSPPGPSPRPNRLAEEEEEVTSCWAEGSERTPCTSPAGTADGQLPEPALGARVSSAPTRPSEAAPGSLVSCRTSCCPSSGLGEAVSCPHPPRGLCHLGKQHRAERLCPEPAFRSGVRCRTWAPRAMPTLEFPASGCVAAAKPWGASWWQGRSLKQHVTGLGPPSSPRGHMPGPERLASRAAHGQDPAAGFQISFGA